MILEDFVMLGTTVPEPSSDGRVFVCSAGVSPECRQLIRIYPLARRSVPSRWGVYRIPLQRNPKDSRDESFQIAADRSTDAHQRINDSFEVVQRQISPAKRAALLSRYVVGSIDEANKRRISLAVIQPEAIEVDFKANPASAESPQMVMFDTGQEPGAGARRFAFMPRLKFHDECRWHDLMLRDWGAFELQRKHGESYFRQHLADALHLRPDSSLLIGNMNNQRNAWLVISVLNGIREAPTLFDSLADDRPRISEKLRRAVYDRDGWKCVTCGSVEQLTVDHKWPRSRGGNISLANLQTLCNGCNLAKGDRVGETAVS